MFPTIFRFFTDQYFFQANWPVGLFALFVFSGCAYIVIGGAIGDVISARKAA